MKKILTIVFLSVLLVPVRAQDTILPYPLDTVNGEEVYTYEVERSIGLYRIGVNFKVPQAEIIRFNPQLRERGLHYGETLYIPTGRPVIAQTASVVVADTVIRPDSIVRQDSIVRLDSIVRQDSFPLSDSIPSDTFVVDSTALIPDTVVDGKPVIELALMLPFESQQTKRSVTAERMMAFYQGALLALHDLQNDSVVYRLRVYDIERSEHRVNSLCDSTELNRVRGVLGVVYPIQIERMATWCTAHNVPLLLPFSDDVDLQNKPQLLQFNANGQQEADSLCQWMIARDSIQHCVTIEVKDADLSSSMRTLRKQMKKAGIKSTNLVLRDLIADSAAYALDSTKENLIILHSDRYQHARILLPHLSKLQDQGFRLRIVSQYSWQKENIDMPQVYTSVFTIDADREAYETLWENAYITHHTTDQPRFDLLGYDLMKALVAWLNNQTEVHGLQADIRWIQAGEGGWQNAEVRVIEK